MANQVLGSLCIGEHVPAIVAEDVCHWLTGCVQAALSPDDLQTQWDTWCEGGDDESDDEGELDAPAGAEAHDMPWIDYLDAVDGEDIPSFYRKVFPHATTFVAYDHDAFMSVVALEGHVPDQDIIQAIVGREYNPTVDNAVVLR